MKDYHAKKGDEETMIDPEKFYTICDDCGTNDELKGVSVFEYETPAGKKDLCRDCVAKRSICRECYEQRELGTMDLCETCYGEWLNTWGAAARMLIPEADFIWRGNDLWK